MKICQNLNIFVLTAQASCFSRILLYHFSSSSLSPQVKYFLSLSLSIAVVAFTETLEELEDEFLDDFEELLLRKGSALLGFLTKIMKIYLFSGTFDLVDNINLIFQDLQYVLFYLRSENCPLGNYGQ